MTGFLVYVAGLHGSSPQKWPEMLQSPSGAPLPHLTACALTDEEYALTIDQLVAKYPPPRKE
jgi:hypothetical protein